MKPDWPKVSGPAELGSDEAHVWAVPLGHCACEDEAWAVLSADERLRAEQFRIVAPRRRFTAARAALRALLSRYLDTPAAEIALTEDSNRKPRLAPQSSSMPLHFNLAHSDELSLVAMSHGCEVGVDVERLRSVSHWKEIARRYFHEAESRAILNSVREERAQMFLRCWTAKEAVLKALGVGLSGSLTSFAVPVDFHDGQCLLLPATCAAIPTSIWLQPLAPHRDYVGAIAVIGEKRRIHCFTFEW
jgi:4'-phosphopantetheinyl transferase